VTMSRFENVTVVKRANVYFDGKCVSHTVLFPDGTRKSVGIIFPSSLTFNTGAPEIMELNAGRCRVRLKGQDGQASEWKSYGAGESFSVPGNSSFDIETIETLDYVCHFG
jgi:purine/pyrimidine-nucleoside phosphorylase